MKRILSLLLILAAFLSFAACGKAAPAATAAPTEAPSAAEAPAPTAAPKASPAVADASQMTTVEDVMEDGMVPITGDKLVDGEYPVTVKSSSSMFRIEKAVLTVEDGRMGAKLTMSGKSYLYFFPGTALSADAADKSRLIPYEEDSDGAHTFTIPVEALDAPVLCAAYSKNKELWYDRTLLFRADSLPVEAFREGFFTTPASLSLADGNYKVAVSLSGGSGKASVTSPTILKMKDGVCTAVIEWSSSNYDYMLVGDEKFEPLVPEGNSTFEIPVLYFDRPMTVIADTVAMSEPHEITYTLAFSSESLVLAP